MQFTKTSVFLAYLVHLFTASGAFLGFLGMISYFEGNFQRGTLYLMVAILIDAVDGTLARLVHTKKAIPCFDGSLMDNIIDFQTYTVIPLIMLWKTSLVIPQIKEFLIFAVLIASLYQFSRKDAKTEDHFFLGFPSYWNLTIWYLYWLDIHPLYNSIILLILVILSFIPIKFLYPSRTKYFKKSSIILSVIGTALFAYVIMCKWNSPPLWSLWSIGIIFYLYIILSFLAHKRSLKNV